MADATVKVKAADLTHEVNVKVVVVDWRRARLRMEIAIWLIRMAMWLGNLGATNVERLSHDHHQD
jgi:hypothetical protein